MSNGISTDARTAIRPRPREWCPPEPDIYAYPLGIYLGDGYLANASSRRARLEISLDPRYPRIVAECATAIERISGVQPTVPGKKHERRIALDPWQEAIVARFPKPFLRGLIHSDGSRSLNRFKVALETGPREYVYPRYFFTNLSSDIQGLFCAACDIVGVRWSKSSYKNISVASRKSVALLDSFVGPKE